MQVGLTDLLHDAAALHKFADFIEEYCREQERSQQYVDASGDFFRYAERLARSIKTELRSDVDRARRFPSRIAALRAKEQTLTKYLQTLHALIKPAADAHTLSIPTPLIKFASTELEAVQGMKGSKVVVLLTPHFMYFQRPHTQFREEARQAEMVVSGGAFPKKLGFIELPYSQGPNFFTNLAIFHEIGHFVYEELANRPDPTPEFKRLIRVKSQSVRKAFRKPPDPKILALANTIVESWIKEIFCDLFAVRLVGPAFSFALVEILGMLDLLGAEARTKFDDEHPAPAYRFSEHVKLLRDDSWWSAIATIEPEQKKLLEALANIPRSKYTFFADEETPGPKRLMAAFLDSIAPAIEALVVEITRKPTSAVKRFTQTRLSVEDCLRAGVVPHAKDVDSSDAISIINSAFCFYLTSIPKLLQKYDGPESQNNVEKRSLWTERLEKWTMKAMEDLQIQDQFRRVWRYGPH